MRAVVRGMSGSAMPPGPRAPSCPECDAVLRPRSLFCPGCGGRLDSGDVSSRLNLAPVVSVLAAPTPVPPPHISSAAPMTVAAKTSVRDGVLAHALAALALLSAAIVAITTFLPWFIFGARAMSGWDLVWSQVAVGANPLLITDRSTHLFSPLATGLVTLLGALALGAAAVAILSLLRSADVARRERLGPFVQAIVRLIAMVFLALLFLSSLAVFLDWRDAPASQAMAGFSLGTGLLLLWITGGIAGLSLMQAAHALARLDENTTDALRPEDLDLFPSNPLRA